MDKETKCISVIEEYHIELQVLCEVIFSILIMKGPDLKGVRSYANGPDCLTTLHRISLTDNLTFLFVLHV